MCFAERLEIILKKKNITQKKLANDLQFRRTTISDWKKNGAVPSGDICLKIADYLNVSVEWLITGEEKTLSNELINIIKMYNFLDITQKEVIYLTLKNMYELTLKKENMSV